jgi:hypothetical protein
MSIDLNAPEVQEAIKKAVDDAVGPLVAKRDELLGEVKKLRKDSGIKPEDMERLEAELEQHKERATKAESEAKKFKTDAEKAAKALEAEATFNQRLLVDNGLTDALTKAGVTNPAFLKAVKSTLASQMQVVTEGDQRVAKAGDKALADFVKEWATSDEGKHFVAAPANSGGGSQGGNQQSASKTITRSEWEARPHAERSTMAKDGYKVVD